MTGHLGKYPSLMPTLAAIFHLIDRTVDDKIHRECVDMAIRWCDVLITHARRIYSLADSPNNSAKILLKKLGSLPSSFKQYDLEKKHWAGLITREDRHNALEILVHHNYLLKEVDESTGGRKSETYHINPKALKVH